MTCRVVVCHPLPPHLAAHLLHPLAMYSESHMIRITESHITAAVVYMRASYNNL